MCSSFFLLCFCVCLSVCMCERQRERECMFVCEKESLHVGVIMCVCVFPWVLAIFNAAVTFFFHFCCRFFKLKFVEMNRKRRIYSTTDQLSSRYSYYVFAFIIRSVSIYTPTCLLQLFRVFSLRWKDFIQENMLGPYSEKCVRPLFRKMC
jgi:hypothetical protein